MALPNDGSDDMSFVSPGMGVRRPSFAQVLQLTGSGSQLLRSNTQGDISVTIPKNLFTGIIDEGDEDANKRKQLYQGSQGLNMFAPAEQQKKATEIMMKKFVSDLRGQSRSKKNFWLSSKKKTFEEKFIDKVTGPEVKDISDVIGEIEKTWEAWVDRPKKFEKARNLLLQFSNKINDFKAVFTLIPSDSMYTSTLYAALTLLIKTSANYHAMAEGFATALDQITFELSNTKDLHALYDTEEMTTVVISLYSHVMKFLCASMKWCMEEGPFDRFLSSFQEGGYWSKVSKNLETVKVLAQRVKDIASKAEKVENRDQNIRAQEAERRATAERAMMWSMLQFLVAKQCEQDEVVKSKPTTSQSFRNSKGRPKIKELKRGSSDPTGAGQHEIATAENPLSSASLFPTAHELFSEYLKGIDVRRDLSKIKLWHSSLTKISLAPEPVRRIREWVTSPDPAMLWLRGYIVQRSLMNPITTLAANIVSAVQLAQVPVLYYFCGLHICSGSSKTPTVTIMTSFVLQALEWREKYPQNSEENDMVFTEERLEAAITIDNIWDLFVDIVRLLPKAPVIVIDLIDTYHRYGDDVRDLIERLATLVPELGSRSDDEEEEEEDIIVGSDGLKRSCKILVTSRTICPMLDKTLLKRVRVDTLDSPRWRGSRNSELELGSVLREEIEKAESDHSLSEDSDDSEGYVTQ